MAQSTCVEGMMTAGYCAHELISSPVCLKYSKVLNEIW